MLKTDFVFLLHNHQPCDNFGWVFEEAFRNAYEPFLDLLAGYPRVKVVMHYSGSLLEWMGEAHPEFFDKLRTLIKRRQVELLSGGFYEPILPIIPERDRTGQIRMQTEFIRRNFECMPRGIWLTERVWDKSLETVLTSERIDYTVMDENHVRQAGVSGGLINGYHDLSNGVKIFAMNKKLRYLIPFAKVADVTGFFRTFGESRGQGCVVFGDDGEKFGFWPKTHNWVYGRKWLRTFFEVLNDEKGSIRTITLSEAADKYRSLGRIDVPRASYPEMMRWAKGDFENFFKIYPEANIMRNRMIHVSGQVADASARALMTSRQKDTLDVAKKELYMAQSGCAYWHGIFGGLYMNHLRAGVYRHLIKAERLIDEINCRNRVDITGYDLDSDSRDEVIMKNCFLDIYIKPDSRGAIFELDDKVRANNMINTIARREESYHSKLRGWNRLSMNKIKKEIEADNDIDIHSILGVKGGRLRRLLVYDEREKSCFVDYMISGRMGIRDFAEGRHGRMIKLAKYPYRIVKLEGKGFASFTLEKEEDFSVNGKIYSIHIKKEISMFQEPEFRVKYSIKNLSATDLKFSFATEFNWSMMNRRYLKRRDFRKVDTFAVRDEWEGSELMSHFEPAVRLWTLPIYTVNETEGGLDRSFQSLCFLAQRQIDVAPGDEEHLAVTVHVG